MSSHIIHSMHTYLYAHPHVGLAFAFTVAFLESLPVLGTIMPGAITMTIVGWMMGSGLISPSIALALTTLGAASGDIIGFYLGKRYRLTIHHIWPFSRYPKILAHGEAFFTQHGGKSIVIGRFVGPARSTVPLVAGVMELGWARFLIAMLPTAFLWSIVYTLPGVILGAFSTEIPPSLLTEYMLMGLAIIVAGWALFWLIQRFFTNIQHGYHTVIDTYWDFLSNHKGTRLVTTYLQNRQAPHSHHQLSRLLLALVFWCVFIIIAISVMTHSSLTHVNLPVFHLTQSLRIYHLDGLFALITDMGKTTIMLGFAIVLSACLCLAREWRTACHLLAATAIATIIVFCCKHFFFNPRPTGFMVIQPSSSFPSGHTTLTTTVLGMLAFFTSRIVQSRWRLAVFSLYGLLILAIAFSRLYLGAHWFLDVMGGLFLGLAIVLSVAINYQRLPSKTSHLRMPLWRWCALVFIVFGLINVSYAVVHHKRTQFQATPFKKVLYLSQSDWWQRPLDYTPTYRRNRLGQPYQPLNLQIAANLPIIKTALQQAGWHAISRTHHIQDTIQRLTNQSPQYHLPLFELLFQNERPSLVAYHNTENAHQIQLLRLWNTHIILTPNKTPLWIGMVVRLNGPSHRLVMPHGHLSYYDTQSTKPLLNLNWQKQVVTAEKPHTTKKHVIEWNHQVWIFKQASAH